MSKTIGPAFLLLVAWLGAGCGNSKTAARSPGKGGQPGSSTDVSVDSGGAGAKMDVEGGAGGVPAADRDGGGGSITTSEVGGRGGSPAGGAGGTGGTTCPIGCVDAVCPYGLLSGSDACGCPICAPPDGGHSNDSAADAGQADRASCPPVICPQIACASPSVPNPDPCGCPTCPPVDAAGETGKIPCVDLTECACSAASGCVLIAEECYCQYPQCGAGSCACSGGKLIGCAPVGLGTCSAAQARVAGLCPELAGNDFDKLCTSANSGCVTKCLNQVGSCGDIYCSIFRTCSRATDLYATCMSECMSALAK